MKTNAAFEFTVRKMEHENRKLYFWTFTFRDVHNLKTAMRLWNEFLTMLKRKLGFRGARVLELHEEHGAHFHVITDVRFKIRQILEIGPRYGFGRTNVKCIKDVQGNIRYLCKYLSKPRAKCLKRVRLWAAFGDIERTRVADIVTDSPQTRIMRKLMGLPSPLEVLEGKRNPSDKINFEGSPLKFLQAKRFFPDAYLETFDPDYRVRKARWRSLKHRGLCKPSPAGEDDIPKTDEAV